MQAALSIHPEAATRCGCCLLPEAYAPAQTAYTVLTRLHTRGPLCCRVYSALVGGLVGRPLLGGAALLGRLPCARAACAAAARCLGIRGRRRGRPAGPPSLRSRRFASRRAPPPAAYSARRARPRPRTPGRALRVDTPGGGAPRPAAGALPACAASRVRPSPPLVFSSPRGGFLVRPASCFASPPASRMRLGTQREKCFLRCTALRNLYCAHPGTTPPTAAIKNRHPTANGRRVSLRTRTQQNLCYFVAFNEFDDKYYR